MKLLKNIDMGLIEQATKKINKLSVQHETLKTTMKEFKYSEKNSDEYLKLCNKEILFNYELRYETENRIVLTGSYCLNIFVDIWNKYSGKKLGEKTKDKIYDEFYNATDKHFKTYISNNNNICFIHMNKNTGCSTYIYNYKDLDFYLPYDVKLVDADNKIINIDIENIIFSQYHGIKNIKDAKKSAKECIKKANKAQELAQELNNLISELNKEQPQKIEYISGMHSRFIK